MSRWTEEFNAHPIHTTLQELKALAETSFDNVDPQEIPEKRRFLKVIQSYEDTLKKLDPELVPMNQLDSLNTALRDRQFWSQITSYASNGDVAHLTQVNNLLSQQLIPLSLLLAIAKKTSREIPIRGLEEAVDSTIETLIAKKDELSTSLDSLQGEVTKLESVVETRRTETDAQLSQWQQQFSEAQERRNIDYTTWREGVDKQTQEAIQTILIKTTEATKKIEDGLINKTNEILSDGKEKHDAILELYELTAGDSVGAGYIQNAEIEKKQANFWRWTSIVFILTTAVWLLYSYNHSDIVKQPIAKVNVEASVSEKNMRPVPSEIKAVNTNDVQELNWLKLLATLSLTGVLLFGAAYSSQQSNHHRKNERRARRFALQMKAFDPFINSLEPTVQAELKKELSQKLFGNVDEGVGQDGSLIDEHALKVITKSIVDILDKANKG